MIGSVAPEPKLGLDLARAFGQKAQLSSPDISKKLVLEIFPNTSFFRTFEKDHWHSTFLIEKIQVFLSTMTPEGHF